jgi:hypothetical protein
LAVGPCARDGRVERKARLGVGTDLTTVARRLGDDEVTVLQTYSHHVPSADERTADVLAAALVDLR